MVKKLLNQMTLLEKIGQLNLTGLYDSKDSHLIKEGKIGSILLYRGYKQIKEAQEVAVKESRLKIPLLFGDDVIHGYRTITPIPLAEACSWNLDLIEKVADLTKQEAYQDGINWIYAPMIDITYDPRWGRIMETSGEDPYYTSLIAQAKVKGIQKPLPNGHIVAACAKHFLGYGAVEAGLDYNTTDFSKYRMRNIYLPPFQSAIKAQTFSIMNAFTTFEGLPITINQYLLKDVLRKECGFNGVLVSDWACLNQITKHGVASNLFDASIKSITAGIDIDLQGDVYINNLAEAVKDNKDLEILIDEAVLRVLKMKEKVGLFKNPYHFLDDSQLIDKIRKASRDLGDESIILLKNDNNTLPLKDVKETILVVGPYNDDKDIHLGAWANNGKAEDVISIKEGLDQYYENIIYFNTSNDLEIDYNHLASLINKASKIIVTLGEPRSYSGENKNRQSLDLPFNQNELVNFLAGFNKPLIALVMAGRPLTINNLVKKASSILWCWYLGVEAGSSIVCTLTGIVNPSGKTVVTFPKSLGQVPLYYNQLKTGRSELLSYVDGDLEPLFPFGFGLNYGNIKYLNLNITFFKKTFCLLINYLVSNHSDIETTEITQVYFSSHHNLKLRPKQELCGFKRVKYGKHETKWEQIVIDLNNYFKIEDYKKLNLTIMVGSSSRDGLSQEIIIEV